MANIVEKIADAVGKLGVKANYGDKVEIGGVEVLPVSLVQFGFGGGSDEQENGGGGGGGVSIPVGVYAPTPDGPRFQPNLITLLGVSIPLICVTGWALAKIFKALKH